MASKVEPKLNQNGVPIKWDPSNIPSTKPFVNFVTSAYEQMTTFDNMRFVKTRSLIYTPFHKEPRYVNFEIGYCKDSKWLEFANDKWMNFANFFISGYFEAVYTVQEKGSSVTYAQIEAKSIDYDPRFRNSSSPLEVSSSFSPTSSSTNIFAQKRNKSSSAPHTPEPRNNPLSQNTPQQEEESDVDSDVVITNQDPPTTTPKNKSRKRSLSDLCNDNVEPDPSDNEPDEKSQSYDEKGTRKDQESRGRRKSQGDRKGRGRGKK